MSMKRFILIAFLILLTLSSARCAIYYVDYTGGLDSNDGLTTITAWKTHTKVNSSMGSFVAGDSILFKRGESWPSSYILITKGGSSTSSRITFGAYGTGAKPVLSGGYSGAAVYSNTAVSYITVENFSCGGGCSFLGADRYDIKLSGIDVTGGTNAFFFTRTDGVTIQSCTASGHTNGGVVFYGESGQIFGTCNGLVEDVIISGGSDCFTIHPDDTNTYYPGDNFTFRRCIGSGASEDGIDIGKYHDPVDNVLIEDCEFYSNGSRGINCILSNSTVRRNYVHNESQGMSCNWGTNGVTISYNIFAHNTSSDFTTTTTAGATVQNVNMYNNVFYGDASKTASLIYIRANSNLSGFNFKNNICWSSVSGYIIQYESPLTVSGTTSVLDYNCYWWTAGMVKFREGATAYNFADWKTATGQDAHSVNSDPLFVDLNEMIPRRTSPCINAGTDVGLTEDYEGRRVPRGSAPDIGVYEYARFAAIVIMRMVLR